MPRISTLLVRSLIVLFSLTLGAIFAAPHMLRDGELIQWMLKKGLHSAGARRVELRGVRYEGDLRAATLNFELPIATDLLRVEASGIRLTPDIPRLEQAARRSLPLGQDPAPPGGGGFADWVNDVPVKVGEIEALTVEFNSPGVPQPTTVRLKGSAAYLPGKVSLRPGAQIGITIPGGLPLTLTARGPAAVSFTNDRIALEGPVELETTGLPLAPFTVELREAALSKQSIRVAVYFKEIPAVNAFNPALGFGPVDAAAVIARDGSKATVSKLRGGVWGGEFSFAPFTVTPGTAHVRTVLSLNGVQLEKIAAMYGDGKLRATGVLDGTVPIQIRSTRVTVDGGVLGARPEGGTINYDADQPPAEKDSNSELALVYKAVRNVRYDFLRADASSDPSGNLKLAVTLKGHNPDLNNGQPVNVNLALEENLPALIKSLGIVDRISSRLEDHMERRK